MTITPESVWADVDRIRAQAPLVHNITNFVVMNTTANALLAITGEAPMPKRRWPTWWASPPRW